MNDSYDQEQIIIVPKVDSVMLDLERAKPRGDFITGSSSARKLCQELNGGKQLLAIDRLLICAPAFKSVLK